MSKAIIKRISQVLESVANGLTEENVSDAQDLLAHGEMGEALSLICTQAYEYDVEISSTIYEEIESLGKLMEMNPSEWEILKELIC